MSLYVGASLLEMRLSSLRRATHSSMSTSHWSVKSGIVAFDSAMRLAIVCWVRPSSTVLVSPFARMGSGRDDGGCASAAGVASLGGATPPAAAAWRSLAPAWAAAAQRSEVHAALARHPPCERRGSRTLRRSPSLRRRGRRPGRGGCAAVGALLARRGRELLRRGRARPPAFSAWHAAAHRRAIRRRSSAARLAAGWGGGGGIADPGDELSDGERVALARDRLQHALLV